MFEIECGKGTYVRSLARDMGRDLGCFGHIAELRRTEVDPFTADDFVTIAELEAARAGDAELKAMAMPARSGFDARSTRSWSTPARRSNACRRSRSPTRPRTGSRLGNPVIIRGRDAPVEAEEACATARGKLVAIGAIEQGMFKPKRVFATR